MKELQTPEVMAKVIQECRLKTNVSANIHVRYYNERTKQIVTVSNEDCGVGPTLRLELDSQGPTLNEEKYPVIWRVYTE